MDRTVYTNMDDNQIVNEKHSNRTDGYHYCKEQRSGDLYYINIVVSLPLSLPSLSRTI